MPLQDQRLQNVLDIAMQVDIELANAKASTSMLSNTVLALQKNVSDLQAKLAEEQQPQQSSWTQLVSGLGVNGVLDIHKASFDPDPNARPFMAWFQPGPTGNSNPNPSDPHGSWAFTDSPTGRKITVSPAAPNNNFFFGFNVVKGNTSANRYVQIVTFELPDDQIQNCMAVETNWEHSIGGFRYNQGSQILIQGNKLKTPVFRYFDIAMQKWVSLSQVAVPPLGTGKPLTIINEVQRDSTGMSYLAVTLNNSRYPLSVHTNRIATNWGAYLQHGFQMDTMASVKPYSVNLLDTKAAWL